MTYDQLSTAAREAGFTAWVPLTPAAIDPKQQVRDMCAVNSCGQYGKRWSCPPGCGTLEDCRAALAKYSGGILVQTVGDVEDSFDFEAMQEIEAVHKSRFEQMYASLRRQGASVLALGAGCCTKCQSCTYPASPCRFPEEMVSSMESYGVLVTEVCQKSGLPYYYGSGKMAYTSCFLLQCQVP